MIKKILLQSLFLLLGSVVISDDAPFVPTADLQVPDDLEVTLWAKSPLLLNPTNMDTDSAGRIWVAEGVNYRRTLTREEGDRIVVIADTDNDGVADSSHTFVQDQELISPLGVSVFDNKIVVAQPPHILVYTDVDRNLKFHPDIDTREEFLSGFNARNHDHSLHATVAGPDGNWYFNQGNCGARIKDKDGRVFQSGGPYYNSGAGTPEWFNNPTEYAGKPSDDGNTYSAGFAGRIAPDGSGLQIIGDGFRNSYELCVNSFGDIFQNDNDDPPACRNTWLMEGGSLGFFSKDGTRLWQTDRRPGQSMQRAHWRQDDPGIIPAGDIHGPGSPTGVTFYENGALPEKYEGMFLSCEARARVIQSYHPQLSDTGAAVELGERSNFLTCEENIMFRPSDVMIGADGALYVSDWYDAGVGGHKAEDKAFAGAIYRIAPKGFTPNIPALSGDMIKDAISLLKSPATNVRLAGFDTLKAAGASALPAVTKLLDGESPWFSARAVWLLPYLGESGIDACRARLKDPSAEQRILAFRSLRAAGHDVIKMAQALVKDPASSVRREVAVSLRDLDPKAKLPLVVELFTTSDGSDRHYLEACGLAAEDIEAEVWDVLNQKSGKVALNWSDAFTWNTWRLMPEAAVPALITRSTASSLTPAQRKFAMESMAFVGSKEAVDAIADLATGESELANDATWWLVNRGLTKWAHYGTRELLKERGIYDPDKIIVQAMSVPDSPPTQLPSPQELVKITGDPVVGKAHAARCVMCHKIDGVGVEYGPDLRDWVANQGKEAFFEAVINPSGGIAHGYQGFAVNLKDGRVVEGLVFSKLDPHIVVSTGGVEQMIPKNRIKNMKKMWDKSLMLSADQLGFTADQLVDLAAFMETYRSTP
ncbi:MAG: dehydrogenase [Verrucomicrobiales bacterium]|nr:dehydrogenase [Verrucomicrobiales bacterium]